HPRLRPPRVVGRLGRLSSGVCETRRVGPSGAVASLVLSVSLVTLLASGRVCACLRNDSSGCARQRRSGARCWLDQELVRPVGVTHHRLAARFPCIQTGIYRTLRVELEDQTGCLQTRWITWSGLTHTAISTCSRLS